MLELRLFQLREFVAASSTVAATYFALVGWTILFTQYVQYVLGRNALGAGLALLPMAGGQLLGSVVAPRLLHLTGSNVTIACGLMLLTVATAAFLVNPLVGSFELVLVNRFVEGIGLGLVVVPTTSAVLRAADRDRVGVGSAVNDTMRLTAATLGLAAVGGLFTTIYRIRIGHLSYVPPGVRVHAQASAGAALAVAQKLSAFSGGRLHQDSVAAFVSALHVATAATVTLLGITTIAAWKALPRKRSNSFPLTEQSLATTVPIYEIQVASDGIDAVMTARKAAHTNEAPQPTGRYSQGIIAGGLCFLAGQAPFDAQGVLVEHGLEAQIRQCFSNLEAVAAAAGTSISEAVRIGVFVSPRADLAEYNRVYAEIVTHDPPPARTTIISDLPGFDIEIDAVCLVP
jgi:reactive intermediate/imine deaminase